ncbi:polysaccharide biosynthesis/export family protein [Flavobacterium sp. SUN046]|uniref:polysaccharide biosynthesis/export family protein n=1 Tax=Flavobacterium sp. SUN046 TaxID=3002440 RepID=UPI002DBFEB21|nr:polysaccharide biosynthesis/export family protein [Flavobacterium sp. SUN046]MEC4049265.1 polysaccharide biosynthesis/export family protein [Flavobacterium sp. SUN046]
MKTLLKSLAIILLFASCKTHNLLEKKVGTLDKAAFAYDDSYQYKIRKDDKISLSVWGEDNLSVGSVYGIYNSNEVYGKWLLVDANGNIEVPRIGTKNVLDKTIPQLKEELKNEFKKWLVTPVIDVKVLNKEITILGEVRNPNTFQVDKDKNYLLEMISKTGGFEFYANIKSIKILRQEGQDVKITNIDLTNSDDILNTNVLLHPGDVVIVPSKKNKEFDKRISTVIPFATTITAAAILMKAL